jgi:hypothetical protein
MKLSFQLLSLLTITFFIISCGPGPRIEIEIPISFEKRNVKDKLFYYPRSKMYAMEQTHGNFKDSIILHEGDSMGSFSFHNDMDYDTLSKPIEGDYWHNYVFMDGSMIQID